MQLNVNGQKHEVDAPDDTPLLWVIRDIIGLTGTKYGCGIAQCGACTVLLDGEPRRACSLPVSEASGEITTIEGIAKSDSLSAVQQAWVDHQVAQCGFCQSGQIMSATALLAEIPDPSDDEIDRAMSGNLCRCGTYQRIRTAVHEAAAKLKGA